MKSWARVLAVCILALTTLAVGAAPASAGPAGETPCTDVLLNAMVKGDLVVPAGATCELAYTTVYDNVRLEVRGDLACSGNEPPPTGGNNQVGGSKQGQCSGL